MSSWTPCRKSERRSYLPANSPGELKRVVDFFPATSVCLDPHAWLVDVGVQAPGTAYSPAGTCVGGDLVGVGLWPPRMGEGPGVQERPHRVVAFTERTEAFLCGISSFPPASGRPCPCS